MAASSRNIPRDIALVSMFAALICVCAIMPAIKTGGAVPITLQTFGVLLAGAVLGPTRGFLAVALYLAIGAAGLPVFADGKSGLAVFQGPSVGYLVGFPFAAALCGFIVQRLPRHLVATSVPLIFVAGLFSSVVFIHTLGVAGMVWRIPTTWPKAFAIDSVFYIGDVVKNIFMALVATAVHRAFPDILCAPARKPVPERETMDA